MMRKRGISYKHGKTDAESERWGYFVASPAGVGAVRCTTNANYSVPASTHIDEDFRLEEGLISNCVNSGKYLRKLPLSVSEVDRRAEESSAAKNRVVARAPRAPAVGANWMRLGRVPLPDCQ